MCAWKFLWKVWVHCINYHEIFWRHLPQVPRGVSSYLVHIFFQLPWFSWFFFYFFYFLRPVWVLVTCNTIVFFLLLISPFIVLLVIFILISGKARVWSRSWRGIIAEWRFWWGRRRGRWTAVEEIRMTSTCQLSISFALA